MTTEYTVPGLAQGAPEKVVEILQDRLYQESEASQILKHSHWNVSGPNFIAVHEMIDPQVDVVRNQVDETAERIAALGGSPDGTPDGIVRARHWEPFAAVKRSSTEYYIQALVNYYDSFIKEDRKAIEKLDELDTMSSNIIQDHVLALEQFQWFLHAHLV